ncbi:sigma 54-interacting transcriptional regulator [Adhaeretor mobilis]|uniref:Regulatory protein LuxO n=1 Tax=Adhaeretor mobilis TaxID=1930276 RepID=A0A517N0W8_9BACT|nr:sigma 54-interacting transcriptional regulator [Adhaeretor mobilis]QDT00777.1 Regulatory protein LuxO [Adhaeretor mobilis]
MYAYLTLLTGKRSGTNFSLDPTRETLIGRGSDCHVTLLDPKCSRVHAIIHLSDSGWEIVDQKSRNGIAVNGQKVHEATLADTHHLHVGSNEFSFHLSDDPPTAETTDPLLVQTIVQDMPIAVQQSNEEVLAALPTPEQAQELVLLYQLSIQLLGREDPDSAVRIALGLLEERTKAAVVAFLWVDDEGNLRPQLVYPQEKADRLKLSESLTELVLQQGHAIWVANQPSEKNDSEDSPYADAVCAPLVRKGDDGERATLGALHVYLEDGRFRQSDFDFIIAVANLLTIALVRAHANRSLQTEHERLVAASPGYGDLIGDSKPMQALKRKIDRVAKAPGGVLIRGESGAGKELVARAIHRLSPRAEQPLVSVNCAAIPADLIESHLFGHKQGAFTGADRDHIGYFQQANLGTLFLDEVGELPLEGQAKLLRILEGHPFLPVGATHEVTVDVRLVAATNRDLQSFVREKKFREDLYYRLSIFELQVPPLRERGDDVALLIDFFLDHYRVERGRPGLTLSKAARAKLVDYHWPGNVRQLRNVMDSAVVLAEGEEILPTDLGLRDSGEPVLETLEIEAWEKRLIVEALKRTNDNIPEAAKLLGIGRATLYRKVESYNIER